MPKELVRLTLAGVGGAFGGREDLSVHVHACLLALRTGKPVKMSYSREESFYGHVHRHPAWMTFEFGAERDGTLVYAKSNVLLDGGAYASSTAAVVGNAGTLGLGPYRFPSVSVDAYGVYTNNPPCGAMRGFGCVQAAFAHEALMDELAAAVGVDPVEIRRRNGVQEGDRNITGQVIDSAAPVAELLQRVADLPLPPALPGQPDLRDLPGAVGNTTHGEGVRRGVGYSVTYKNIGFSEGFDDYSTARVRLQVTGDEAVATVHTAAAEVGQGLVTVQQQIARTELGVERVVVVPADTAVGSAGSTSASRQTYVTGGAVKAACEAVRTAVLQRAAVALGRPVAGLALDGDKVVGAGGEVLAGLADVLGDDAVEETVEWRHRPTHAVDPETGQGDAHVQFAFSAHRAVVVCTGSAAALPPVPGLEAARLLDGLMSGRPAPAAAVVVAPKGLVARESTDVLAYDDPEVRRAVQFIRDQANSAGLSVDQVARRCSLSRRTLERRFRTILGRSVGDEIVATRMATAEELLLETTLPLREVARRCGFRSQGYFTRVVRRHFGRTPAVLRSKGR